MKNHFIHLISALVLMNPLSGLSDPLEIPNTFVAGRPAIAAEINQNFSAVKESVDSNSSRLVALETTQAGAYNARYYGAKGDGLADDFVAIQSALDAAGATKGTVYVPPGTYLVSNSLVVPPGVILQGAGMNATVLRNPEGALPGVEVNGNIAYATIAMVGVSHSGVRDLAVDHATFGADTNGIVMIPGGPNGSGAPTTYSFVERCRIEGADSHQYLIWNMRGMHNVIRDNVVNGNVLGNTSSQQEGIELFGGEDVQVLNNRVSNVGSSGIYLTEDLALVPGTYFKNILVQGNVVTGGHRGISIPVASEVNNLMVTNNTVTGQADRGLFFATSSSAKASNVLIHGNMFVAQRGNALVINGQQSPHWLGVSIQGNILSGEGGTVRPLCALIEVINVDLKLNSVTNGGATLCQIHSAKDVRIVGNSFHRTPNHALHIVDSERVFVSGNSFTDYSMVEGSSHGVFIQASNGVNRNIRVTDNLFRFGGTESYAAYATPQSEDVQFQSNVLDYVPTFSAPFRNDAAINALANHYFEKSSSFRRGIYLGYGLMPQLGGGSGGIVGMHNVDVPPTLNTDNGGVLYVEGGALKYRGSNGTITVLGTP